MAQTSITLSWQASTDNVGVVDYRLFRSGSRIAAVSNTGYTFTGLVCGSTYSLGVAAVDAAGNQSSLASITAKTLSCPTTTGTTATTATTDTTPPSTPTKLATSALGQATVTLLWTASTDNVGVAGYHIYRPGTSVATATTTSYKVGGLTCGTNYTLSVSAFDAAGNASAQATIQVKTSACLLAAAGAGPTAVVWVGLLGNAACARSAVPLDYATALVNGDVCDTFDHANKVALNGDTVLVQGGSYPRQILLYAPGRSVGSGTCVVAPTGARYAEQSNYGGCVTFAPSPGQTVSLDGIDVLTSGVRIQDMTLTNPGTPSSAENIGITVEWSNTASGASCKAVPQPHDVVFDGMRVYVSGGTPATGSAPLSGVYISGIYNVAVINSDFGPVYDNQATWQLADLTPSSSPYCAGYSTTQLQDNHVYVGHVTYHDLIQDCWVGTCYSNNHIAGIHWRASNSWLMWSTFTNIAQQAIEVQTMGVSPNIQGSVFAGNVFDKPCSNQGPPCGSISSATFTATGPTDTLTNDVIAFNSFYGTVTFNNDNGNPNPYPGLFFGGNILGTYIGNGTANGCPIQGTFTTNAVRGAGCSRDFPIAAFPFTNPAPPTYDFSLNGNPNIANTVPISMSGGSVTAYCPVSDLAGNPRPMAGNANCAAGARG